MGESVGNLHPAFRAFWHPIAWASEVDLQPWATTLLGTPLVALRDSTGAVVVFHDECPHRGAPLSLGAFDDGELVCAFHGWRFGLDGVATCIPALGPEASIPGRARLGRPAQVCERHGIVWVALETPRQEIPEWPDGDDPHLGTISPAAHTSEVLAAYQTDNLLDASHFPFLHDALGSRNPLMGDHHVVDEHPLGFRTTLQKFAADDVSTEGWLHYTLAAPFTVLLRSEEPDGSLRTSFFQAIQPIDERMTRMFFMIRVPQTDPEQLAEMLLVEEGVLREDHRMTSAQRRVGMHVVGGPDLHVRSDRNGVLYRRTMRNVIGFTEPLTDE
jgi:vanillate O-demethylase monooxygenase subunit